MSEQVARILGDAGWVADEGRGGFTYGTCVGGLAPDGNVYVKNWAAIRPGHPKYGPDTPDTAEEAAQWLADRYKAPEPEANPLSLESLEFRQETPVAPEQEAVEDNPQDDGNIQHHAGPEGDQESQASDVLVEPEVEADASVYEESEEGDRGVVEATTGADYTDADFTIEDLGHEAEQLEGPIEDFAPDEFAPEPEPDQARFYGLDDLDRVRSLRIGDVATEALRLTTMIEQIVSEAEGEFASIQAYVVSHLDKHTGAFTPQDDQSRQTYARFLELSSARSKITLIDQRRREATAQLLVADRDEVVAFDVAEAFR